MIIEHDKRLVAQLVCIGNSNAILPMTTVAGVPPFHFGGTRGLTPCSPRVFCVGLKHLVLFLLGLEDPCFVDKKTGIFRDS
jgi:hypothetical protein